MNVSTQPVRKADKTGGRPSLAKGDTDAFHAKLVHTSEGELDLQDLDFVEKVDEPSSLDPEHRHKLIQEKMQNWRQIFLTGLEHQIALVRDPGFRYPRQHFVDCEGVMARALEYVAPEPWWYEQDGEVHLRLNFGERDWFVKGKNPVIRIGAAEQLLPALEKLHLLTGAGDLDEIIEKMVIVSQR